MKRSYVSVSWPNSSADPSGITRNWTADRLSASLLLTTSFSIGVCVITVTSWSRDARNSAMVRLCFSPPPIVANHRL
ncbi:MAG: hypothetical protein QXZ09_04500 [Candidatus Methanomethylicaceae archaeon]